MSKELIKVTKQTIGSMEINAVDARDLHSFLEVKKQFTDWIYPKINEYGFVENSDFYPSRCIASNGREMETYIISIDMAKELAMVSNVPKGKEARKYFIECERIAKSQNHAYKLPNFNNPVEAARAWADKEEQRQLLEIENKKQTQRLIEQEPKVRFADAVTSSPDSILIGDLAKLMNQNGVDTGQNRLFSWMRDNGYLMKRKGQSYNMPSQRSMDGGWMETKIRTVLNPDGTVRIKHTPVVTSKGQIYFINLFLKVGKQQSLFSVGEERGLA